MIHVFASQGFVVFLAIHIQTIMECKKIAYNISKQPNQTSLCFFAVKKDKNLYTYKNDKTFDYNIRARLFKTNDIVS